MICIFIYLFLLLLRVVRKLLNQESYIQDFIQRLPIILRFELTICVHTDVFTRSRKTIIRGKTTGEKTASDGRVRASHILIKHQGSRRPVSWKDPEGYVIINTTRDDIVSDKAKFQVIASRYSDCSSAKRGGDLGPFSRGQMQKPFEKATCSLRVGELSDIVDTDSGRHIIMRIG